VCVCVCLQKAVLTRAEELANTEGFHRLSNSTKATVSSVTMVMGGVGVGVSGRLECSAGGVTQISFYLCGVYLLQGGLIN
jgi:hypothetical protein